jgi:hypothetical protein
MQVAPVLTAVGASRGKDSRDGDDRAGDSEDGEDDVEVETLSHAPEEVEPGCLYDPAKVCSSPHFWKTAPFGFALILSCLDSSLVCCSSCARL